MSFLSLTFAVFVLVLLPIYYLTPKAYRWIVLLVGSLVFYYFSGWTNLFYILLAALSTYLGALHIHRQLQKRDELLAANKGKENKELRLALKAKCRRNVLIVKVSIVVLCLTMLVVFKYYDDMVKSINEYIQNPEAKLPLLNLIMPLGLSFYTFQVMGYLFDVGRGEQVPERNFLRYLGFVCYFPQLVQGPISRYNALAPQLEQGEDFKWSSLLYGIWRILWGMIKKLLIADRVRIAYLAIWVNIQELDGIYTIFAVFLYTIQLYCDFSGGIDIALGVSDLFGIKLRENFERPYFAVTLGDYWRRWHQSLYDWLVRYVYYPLNLTTFFAKLGKKSRQLLGHKHGKYLPSFASSLTTRMLMALWHGGTLGFYVFGLYHGISAILSTTLEPLWTKMRRHFNTTTPLWRVFVCLRTYVVITIGYYFLLFPSVSEGFALLIKSFTNVHPAMLANLIQVTRLGTADYCILLFSCLLLFLVSYFQEKGHRIRIELHQHSIVLQAFVTAAMIIMLLYFSVQDSNIVTTFAYAKF